jgi:hypothetical protein
VAAQRLAPPNPGAMVGAPIEVLLGITRTIQSQCSPSPPPPPAGDATQDVVSVLLELWEDEEYMD